MQDAEVLPSAGSAASPSPPAQSPRPRAAGTTTAASASSASTAQVTNISLDAVYLGNQEEIVKALPSLFLLLRLRKYHYPNGRLPGPLELHQLVDEYVRRATPFPFTLFLGEKRKPGALPEGIDNYARKFEKIEANMRDAVCEARDQVWEIFKELDSHYGTGREGGQYRSSGAVLARPHSVNGSKGSPAGVSSSESKKTSRAGTPSRSPYTGTLRRKTVSLTSSSVGGAEG